MMVGCGTSMSERFTTEREGINESDTPFLLCVTRSKGVVGCGGCGGCGGYGDVFVRGKKREGLPGLFIMSQMRKAAYSWISI